MKRKKKEKIFLLQFAYSENNNKHNNTEKT